MYKFPEFTTKSVIEKLENRWDLPTVTINKNLSAVAPLPKFELQCGFCDFDEDILCKHWQFHRRNKNLTENPYRCDVGMKCTACSAVWQHGLVITEELWPGRRITLHYRKVKDQLEEAGY